MFHQISGASPIRLSKISQFSTASYQIFDTTLDSVGKFKHVGTFIGLQAEQIFSVNIKYTYFFNFGRGFWGSFSTLFLKAPGSCGKRIVKIFLKHCASICMTSKYLSQTFKILFQTGNINIFVLSCVSFSRYIKLKSFFSDEEK